MPDISLNDYLAQIESMLEDKHYEEATFHCRHILTQAPKNLTAYRYLGRALLERSQWEEAGEVLRRILSVVPDDREAHYGLSQVYSHTKQSSQAIWHLERAWEHDPNDNDMSAQLRDMYFVHRGVENVRLQLTAGAVARQYGRDGLFDQSIGLLKNTLKEARDRVDLRLLLARVQREAGRRVDAAETALDIVSVLPDCLEANFILAELWLSEQRPSDAQRYLSRVEPVDPYLALRLAQGGAVADDAVEIDYGDYQNSASREMSQADPDWLTELGDDDQDQFDEADEFSDEFEAMFADDIPEFEAEDTNDALLDDMTETDDDLLAMLKDDDDVQLDDDALLALLEESDNQPLDDVTDDDALQALFDDDMPEDTDDSETGPPISPTGMLVAFEKSQTGELSQPDDEFFTLEDDLLEEADDAETRQVEIPDTPMEDDEPDDDLDALFEEEIAEPPQAPGIPTSEEDDPMAWLQESGVEIVDGEGETFDSLAYEEDDDIDFGDPEAVDPIAWLQDDEARVPDEETPAQPSAPVDPDELDPMAWLQESGVEVIDEDSDADNEPSADYELEALEDDDEANEYDNSELLNEMLAMEDLTSEANEEGDMSDQDGDGFDWLDNDDDTPDWLAGEEDDTEQAATASDAPDWLASMDPETSAEAEADLAFLMEEEGDDDDLVDADTPDWLSDASPETEAEADLDFLMEEDEDDDLVDADTPDWLSEVSPEAETEAEADEDFDFLMEEDGDDDLVDTDTPDWLSEVSPEAETEAEADEDFDFLMEEDGDDDLVDADTPDWLSEVSPEAETEAEAEADLDFLMEEDDDDLVDADTPDWLAEVSPETEAEADLDFLMEEDLSAEPDADEAPAWLADFDEEDEDDDSLFALEAEDAPDWLDDVAEDDTSPPEELEDDLVAEADEDDFTFEAEEDDPAIEDEDLPDWLDDLDEEGDSEPAEEFSWLDDLSDPQETEAATLDIGPGTPQADEFEQAVAAMNMDMEAVPERAPDPADNAPDWLNAMVPGFDVDYEAEEDQPIERAYRPEIHAAAAREGADSDFSWLSTIVAEEMFQPPEISAETMPGVGVPASKADQPARRYVFSQPPAWLRRLRGNAAMTGAPAVAATDSLPNTEEDTIGNDLPDWLTAGDDDMNTPDDKSDIYDNAFFAEDLQDDNDDLFGDDLFDENEDDLFSDDDDLFGDDDDLFGDDLFDETKS